MHVITTQSPDGTILIQIRQENTVLLSMNLQDADDIARRVAYAVREAVSSDINKIDDTVPEGVPTSWDHAKHWLHDGSSIEGDHSIYMWEKKDGVYYPIGATKNNPLTMDFDTIYVAQIPESYLLPAVLKLMDDYKDYNDVGSDLEEFMCRGNIFDEMIEDKNDGYFKEFTAQEMEQWNHLALYFHNKDIQYIHIIKI